MGPPSATLFIPDDLDLLALMNCPEIDINYVMKNTLIVFAEEVYEVALQLMGAVDRIDVYDIPRETYEKAIRLAPARAVRHKTDQTDADMNLVWMTNYVEPVGFYIPVPKEIPGHVLEDTKIHCYLSEKNNRPAVRLWNELRRGHKSNFIKTIIRFYLERPIIEPRFFPDEFPLKKTGVHKATGAVGKRKWVAKNKPKDIPAKASDSPQKEQPAIKEGTKPKTSPGKPDAEKTKEAGVVIQPETSKQDSSAPFSVRTGTTEPPARDVSNGQEGHAETSAAHVNANRSESLSQAPNLVGPKETGMDKERPEKEEPKKSKPSTKLPPEPEDTGNEGFWNIFDAMSRMIEE